MLQRGMLKVGDHLGPYVVEAFLGKGAFKEVYKARNTGPTIPEPYVALAIPCFHSEESLNLIRSEFAAQCNLEHPNIARVYEIAEADGCTFLVMDYIEGESLAMRLARTKRPLDQEQAVRCVAKLADALAYTHGANVFHRDVKPDNIIITHDGVPKLIDFGVARIMKGLTHVESLQGTINYSAPEMQLGSSAYPADIWALGVTFYQLLTGIRPFDGENELQLRNNITTKPLDTEPLVKAGVSQQVVSIIKKMLEKRPEDRYANANDLALELSKVIRRITLTGTDEERLEILIRASFPLIHILSYEEQRVLDAIRDIRTRRAEDMHTPVKLYVWSASRGLRDEKDVLVNQDSLGDPIVALEHLIQSPEVGIYVFLDIHRHYEPVTIRLIRDASRAVRDSRKSILLLSPFYSTPTELEKEGTIITFQMPGRIEHERIIDKVAGRIEIEGLPVTLDPLDREALARAASGLTLAEAERALTAAAYRSGGMQRGIDRDVIRQKAQIIRKTGMLEYYPTTESFKDVGGLGNLLTWFRKRLPAFDQRGVFAGLQRPKGVLLVGLPGCGKSLTARALASEWRVPLLRFDVGRVFASYVGQSEGNMRLAIETAEAVSPCILWVDEIEKGFAGSGGRAGDSGVGARVFGTFLTWMQEKRAPVFVVATANNITMLPPEFRRKGRFDEIFFFGLPDDTEREAILRVHLARRKRDPERFDIPALVGKTNGFTGAEIEQAVIDGLFRAFDAREHEPGRDLTDVDLINAIAASPPMSKTSPDNIPLLLEWGRSFARMANGPIQEKSGPLT